MQPVTRLACDDHHLLLPGRELGERRRGHAVAAEAVQEEDDVGDGIVPGHRPLQAFQGDLVAGCGLLSIRRGGGGRQQLREMSHLERTGGWRARVDDQAQVVVNDDGRFFAGREAQFVGGHTQLDSRIVGRQGQVMALGERDVEPRGAFRRWAQADAFLLALHFQQAETGQDFLKQEREEALCVLLHSAPYLGQIVDQGARSQSAVAFKPCHKITHENPFHSRQFGGRPNCLHGGGFPAAVEMWPPRVGRQPVPAHLGGQEPRLSQVSQLEFRRLAHPFVGCG